MKQQYARKNGSPDQWYKRGYIPLLWVESDKVRRSGQIWEASAALPPGEWWIAGGDDDADGVGDGGGGDTDEFGMRQLLLLLVVNGGWVDMMRTNMVRRSLIV